MKKAPSKMTLRRETLRLLEDSVLEIPAGGVTNPCPISYKTFGCFTSEFRTCPCNTTTC